MGGLHVTALPSEATRHADAIVTGEGELSWPDVLADFESGQLRPVYSANGREFYLADAPMPRFDLLEPSGYNRLTVQTQRGCPWRCQFCASSVLLTRRFKVKPVARVIEEVRAVKRAWGEPFLEFADDNTFANKGHGRELMRAMAQEGMRWFTETDISVADDPELLRLMREAGCVQVLVGLESPTPGGVAGVELRRDWKRMRAASYRAAIERIQEHGITVNGCFVLGLDRDTPEAFDAIARFVEESGLFEVQITVLTPLPGSAAYAEMSAEGRSVYDGQWERYTLFDVTFQPTQMPVAALEEGLRELATRLYSTDSRHRRRRAFIRQARGGRRKTTGGHHAAHP